MRGLFTASAALLLAGCLGHRELPQAWTAEVALRHRGPATLERLDEPAGLKVALHQVDVRALARERHRDVERALDETAVASRDDLAQTLLEATDEAELARAAEREDGRRVLARLYGELTAGSVWDGEREQAERVLGLWARRIGLERFIQAIEDERTMIFPVRKPGPTVLRPAVPAARLGESGLDVSYSSNVYQYPEWRTLGGMHVRVADDAVVGVKLYDAGGVVRFVPALFLLEVSNAGQRHALQKCGEMFALGLTLGAAGPASASGRATSALLWCDRTALVLGVALSVVDDHRGWILERFGAEDARFLRATDVLASLVAFYGLGRVAVAVPRVVMGWRRAYLDMKATKAALNAEDKALLDRIGRGVDELLEQSEKAGKGGEVIPIERARKPAPAPEVTQEPLRATGTEGRLVPVASAGEGKPKTALIPAAPASSQGTLPAGGRNVSRPAAPRPSSESAIAAALVQRGLSVSQAQEAAKAATKAGVLDKVEALVRSPGYRNPEKLRDFLEGWNRTNEGKIQALEHKRIFGEESGKLSEVLRKTAFQLQGKGGEVPPAGFTRIADIRFDAKATSRLRSADRNMLRAEFAKRGELSGVDQVRITTDRGTYVFEPPFPIH